MADDHQPTDAEGAASPPEDGLTGRVEWDLSLYPGDGDRGILRTVPFGLPGETLTRLLLEVGLTDDEDGMKVKLTVGNGPGAGDPDELREALGDIAAMLSDMADLLRDSTDGMVEAARAQRHQDDLADALTESEHEQRITDGDDDDAA